MKKLSFLLGFAFLVGCNEDDAGSNGIDFESIPIGTEFHFENVKQNRQWKLMYKGFLGGNHIIERYELRRLPNRTGDDPIAPRTEYVLQSVSTYDAYGRMTSGRNVQAEKTFYYEPFSCFYGAVGSCKHVVLRPLGIGELQEHVADEQNFTISREHDLLTIVRFNKTEQKPIEYRLGSFQIRETHQFGEAYFHELTKTVFPK